MRSEVGAPDGATLVVRTSGQGPGVVVVHGGGVTTAVYRRLADRLGEACTVHLYDRRGRGDAPPRREPWHVEQEVADLGAVLAHTGARSVVGHSSGGFIALTAALTLPVERLALYDAAVSVDGGFPAGWLPSAEAAVRDGDVARALAVTAAGINTHAAASRLPLGLRTSLCRLFLRTAVGATMGELLASTLDESRAVVEADGPATAWSGVPAETLLAYGAAGPRYYATLNDALAGALPHARTLPVARCGHDGINRAPDRLVVPLRGFLRGQPVGTYAAT
jgi:pimeloyl-ACP methyl ester carboxylesterase